MPQRAALYLRISEDRSGEGAGVARQREDAIRLTEQRGMTVVAEYTENHTSAAGRKPRPQFKAMLAAAADGELDIIVAWSMDRLTRTARDRLALVETCQRHSVVIALVRGTDLNPTNPSGRLLIGLLGEVAQHEIDQKSDRQKRAIQQAAEAGRITGGPRAFGYQPGGLELHPQEAPVLRQAYQRWLAGAGLEELADWLNRSGFPTAKGNRWRSNTVRVLLGNPRNGGWRAMRPVVDEATGRRATWHDQPITRAVWPPVVSEEVYAAAMAKLRNPNRAGNGVNNREGIKGPKARYLLSGIARCGQCGERMITGAGGDRVRRYQCISKRHVNRKAEHVEAYVVSRLLFRLAEPDATDLLLSFEAGPDLEAVRAEALAKRQRLRDLASDYAAGVLDRDQVKVAGDELRARLAVLDGIVADAGRTDVVAPLVAADDAAAVWLGYPLSTQRLVIQRLMEITLRRARPGRPKGGVYDTASIEIHWREVR